MLNRKNIVLTINNNMGSRGIMMQFWGVMMEKRRIDDSEQKNEEIHIDKYSTTSVIFIGFTYQDKKEFGN